MEGDHVGAVELQLFHRPQPAGRDGEGPHAGGQRLARRHRASPGKDLRQQRHHGGLLAGRLLVEVAGAVGRVVGVVRLVPQVPRQHPPVVAQGADHAYHVLAQPRRCRLRGGGGGAGGRERASARRGRERAEGKGRKGPRRGGAGWRVGGARLRGRRLQRWRVPPAPPARIFRGSGPTRCCGRRAWAAAEALRAPRRGAARARRRRGSGAVVGRRGTLWDAVGRCGPARRTQRRAGVPAAVKQHQQRLDAVLVADREELVEAAQKPGRVGAVHQVVQENPHRVQPDGLRPCQLGVDALRVPRRFLPHLQLVPGAAGDVVRPCGFRVQGSGCLGQGFLFP